MGLQTLFAVSSIRLLPHAFIRPNLLLPLLTAIAFVYGYWHLNSVDNALFQQVRSGTLVFSSADAGAADLAKWAARTFGCATLDLATAPHPEQIFAALKTTKVMNPALLLGSREVPVVISGKTAIVQTLNGALGGESPIKKGKAGLLMTAAIVILFVAIPYRRWRFGGALIPVLAIFSLAGLSGACLACSSNQGHFDALLPIIGCIYVLVGLIFFTGTAPKAPSNYVGFGTASACIPAIQILALAVSPKLCPACLAFTVVAALWVFASSQVASAKLLAGPRFSWQINAVLYLATAALAIKFSLVALGILPAQRQPVEGSNLLGKRVSAYISDKGWTPGKLIVVTQEYCHACEQAVQQLPKLHTEFDLIPVCTMATPRHCFRSNGLSYVTPMLLVASPGGDIIFQYNGWPQNETELKKLRIQVSVATATAFSPNSVRETMPK